MGREIDHLKERRAEERTFKMEAVQFKQLDDNFDGLNGAINKLTARIGDADKNKSLHQAISDGFADLVKSIDAHSKNNGKWLGQIATVIAAAGTGDLGVIKELAEKLKSSTDDLEAAVQANQPK